MPSTWSPTDISGASLDLSGSSDCVYYEWYPGGVIILIGNIVYPTNSDGSNCAIGNLPFSGGAGETFFGQADPSNTLSDPTLALTAILSAGLLQINYVGTTTAGTCTNAQLSGGTIGVTIIFTT